jgi:chaperonin cofactor prefoldin
LSTESSGLSTQLDAANRKIKKLDGLYQEANAENEALYERFNDELGKILARVKAGEGVKVLKDRVGGLENEVASLRAENRKLKREVIDKDGVEGS